MNKKLKYNLRAIKRLILGRNLTGNDVINRWLLPNYGVTIEYLWEIRPEFREDNFQFYVSYPVNQKAHDRWQNWLIRYMRREHPYFTRKYIKRHIWPIYLNCAPTIKKE
ncbi:MAG: hypothetical protein U9O59_01855 [Actinomycetota bacterium]|nr:hypothetical protein [Actinomycetota bacterium]